MSVCGLGYICCRFDLEHEDDPQVTLASRAPLPIGPELRTFQDPDPGLPPSETSPQVPLQDTRDTTDSCNMCPLHAR